MISFRVYKDGGSGYAREERERGRRERLDLILGMGWFFNWVGLILNGYVLLYPKKNVTSIKN